MCRKVERRLVVVGKDADNLWKRARGAIAGKWEYWLGTKRLYPITFALEDKLSWSRIADLLK